MSNNKPRRGSRGCVGLFLLALSAYFVSSIFTSRSPPLYDGIIHVPGETDEFSRAGEGIVLLPPNDDPRSDEEQWMISAFDAQTRAGLAGATVDSGGCKDLHVGVVAPGRSRGAHRHRGHNESIIIWGGSGVIRVERPGGAYHDYEVTPKQRVLVASPAGLGHGIKCDEGSASAMSIVACSDAPPTRGPDPASDYKIWSDW